MILNRDQEHDFEFDLFLNQEGVSGKPLVLRANAGLDKSTSGQIPNQTTLVNILSETGEILKQCTYGLTHNLKHLPPEMNSNL